MLRWHLTLRAADLEEGAKESYHHGDRGGRRVSGKGNDTDKAMASRTPQPARAQGHRRAEGLAREGSPAQVRVCRGAPTPLGLRALREAEQGDDAVGGHGGVQGGLRSTRAEGRLIKTSLQHGTSGGRGRICPQGSPVRRTGPKAPLCCLQL